MVRTCGKYAGCTRMNNAGTCSEVPAGVPNPSWKSANLLGYDGAGRRIANRYLNPGGGAVVGFTTKYDRLTAPKPLDSPRSGDGRLDLAAIRREVSIADLLRHFSHLDLHGGWAQRHWPWPLYGAPSDQHRIFSVHLGKGVFCYFEASCRVQGNTLDLWATYNRMTLARRLDTWPKCFLQSLTLPQDTATEKPVIIPFHSENPSR